MPPSCIHISRRVKDIRITENWDESCPRASDNLPCMRILVDKECIYICMYAIYAPDHTKTENKSLAMYFLRPLHNSTA